MIKVLRQQIKVKDLFFCVYNAATEGSGWGVEDLGNHTDVMLECSLMAKLTN